MIDKEKITLDWIEKVSKTNRSADKILVEKVIRALLLLEGLVKQNLSFVFKGGTALMLHFNSTKRLSIDIDIIISEKPDELLDIKSGKPNQPKTHQTINEIDNCLKSVIFALWLFEKRY